MKHKGGMRRLVVLALLLLSLVAADATTYYIRTDGNDSNAGTANTAGGAWLTFGRIRFQTFAPGDVVEIAPGTYNEAASAAYTLFNPGVTIRGATPSRPLLQHMAIDVDGGGDNLRLENLIIDGEGALETILTLRIGVTNFAMVGCDLLNPANTDVNAQPHGNVAVESVDGLTIDSCRLIAEPGANSVGNTFNLATRASFGPSQNWLLRDTELSLNPITGNGSGGCIALFDGLSNVEIAGCTFTTAPREHIYINSNGGPTPSWTLANWNIHNCGFQETRVVTSFYIAEPQNLVNWEIRNNVWRNTKDAAFWIDGRNLATVGPTIVDGLQFTGNYFENIGVGLVLDGDGALIIQQAVLAPTAGHSTAISNNTFNDTRGQTQGGWGIYVSANGPGPIIADNHFISFREAAILATGSGWDSVGDRLTGMTNAQIVGNVVEGDKYAAIVLRYENPNVAGAGPATMSNTAVENNTANDCIGFGGFGISLEPGGSVNTLVRYNDSARSGAGIYTGVPCTIYGNVIADSPVAARAGIWLATRGVRTDLTGTIVAFNVTSGCAGYGIQAATENPDAITGNIDIYNNTVVGNQTGGILLGNSGIDCYNNIVAFQSGIGLHYSATTLGKVGYNLLYNVLSGGVDYSGFPGGTTPFAGDLTGQNPQFVSLFGGDFHLKNNSPAIGAGAVLSGGNFTPAGTDMGAFPTTHVSAGVAASAWELYR